MNERGQYGRTHVGADNSASRGHSIVTWIVGGIVVGGAVLWAKHQTSQVEKLYSSAGLPYQSFGQDLRERTKELSATAREKIHGLRLRLGTKKEAQGE